MTTDDRTLDARYLDWLYKNIGPVQNRNPARSYWMLAVALFQREKLTLGQASRLAAMNQWQFQQLLASRQIPLHYDVADFEADLQTLAKMHEAINDPSFVADLQEVAGDFHQS